VSGEDPRLEAPQRIVGVLARDRGLVLIGARELGAEVAAFVPLPPTLRLGPFAQGRGPRLLDHRGGLRGDELSFSQELVAVIFSGLPSTGQARALPRDPEVSVIRL